MGFPVPLHDWIARAGARLRRATCSRPTRPRGAALVDNREVLAELEREPRFGRKVWGLLCLELWQRASTTASTQFKRLLTDERTDDSHEGADHRRRRLHRLAPRRSPARRAATRSLVIDNYATGRRDNLTERDGLTIVEGTIADRGARRRTPSSASRPTCVVHAAASYKDPDDWAEDVRTNALGTANVVAAPRRPRGVERLIYFQTALCYGTAARSSSRSRSTTRSGPTTRATRSRKTAGEQYIALERPRLGLVPAGQRLRPAQHLAARCRRSSSG